MLRVSSRERVSQEQLHCSKEMLVASHPSWHIATQQICDLCFQIYYCPCWFATIDVQQLQRVYVVGTVLQYSTIVKDWQGQLFETFFGRAAVSSSACTHWSRSGSTHWPTDCSNCIERLRQLTLFNLWLSWDSPCITTFFLCTGLVYRIAFPHMCLFYTVNGNLSCLSALYLIGE